MRAIGTQFDDLAKENKNCLEISKEDEILIRETLTKFKNGYLNRDIKKIDGFMEEIFANSSNLSVLGTGNEELVYGYKEIRELIKFDWLDWGDVKIDLEHLKINSADNIAWFYASGDVKQSFKDSKERNESYIDLIKDKLKEGEEQKKVLAEINWILALTYHNRGFNKREYNWPLGLSGVLIKNKSKWQIVHLHFSIPKASFPDERFEAGRQHIENYNILRKKLTKQIENQATDEIKEFFQKAQNKLFNQENMDLDIVRQFFDCKKTPSIIGVENEYYCDFEEIILFFNNNFSKKIKIDLDNIVSYKREDINWFITSGEIICKFREEDLLELTTNEIEKVINSDYNDDEKIFKIKRSIAYVLREIQMGETYSYPIRITGILNRENNKIVFNSLHFSFPFYYILEGKLDGE